MCLRTRTSWRSRRSSGASFARKALPASDAAALPGSEGARSRRRSAWLSPLDRRRCGGRWSVSGRELARAGRELPGERVGEGGREDARRALETLPRGGRQHARALGAVLLPELDEPRRALAGRARQHEADLERPELR